MEFEFGHYKLYALLFLFGLITAEIIWSWKKEKKVYDVKDTFANLAVFAGFQLSKYLFAGYQLALFGFFYKFRIFTFEKSVFISDLILEMNSSKFLKASSLKLKVFF